MLAGKGEIVCSASARSFGFYGEGLGFSDFSVRLVGFGEMLD